VTIQELADRASVTPRTIRYYVEQGILPPPERGRPSEYTEEHLRVLDLVRRLKEQYLPLDEIRSMVQSLSTSQIEEFLSKTAPREEVRQLAPDSAAEYVANVLSRGAAREQLKQAAQPVQSPWAPAPSAPPFASPPGAAPSPPQPSPVTYRSLAEPPHRTGSQSAPASPASVATSAAAPESEETWQRVRLASDIELYYLLPNDPQRQGLVARVIEAARHILAHSGNKTEET
jgi:DNA-binding transcriptional MerR regulator